MRHDDIERGGVHLVGAAAAKLGVIFRELPTSDQGIDGQLELNGADGRATGRLIAVQIKAGKSWLQEETNDAFVFRPSERHVRLWLDHSLPVIVILCDLHSEKCFWEVVSPETCRSTGVGWRIDVPKNKTLRSIKALEDIAAPLAATSEFTVARIEDVSHGLARRISLDIVAHSTHKPMSKVQLAAIVRAAAKIGRESDYARDEISAEAHRGKQSDIVFGFVYLRELDRSSAQWVCRFQWTSPLTNELARYQGLPGEIDSSGLVIDWQLDRSLARFLDKSRRGKGEYLRLVDQLLVRASTVFKKLQAFHSAGCLSSDAEQIAQISEDFYRSWDDSKAAPAECQRLNQAIGELLALIGSLQFIWGRESKYSKKNGQYQSLKTESELKRIREDINFLRRDVR